MEVLIKKQNIWFVQDIRLEEVCSK